MSACTKTYWPRSGLRGSASSVQQLASDERTKRRLEVGLRPARDRGQAGEREALAEDGRVGDQGAIVGREGIEPGRDEGGEGLRDRRSVRSPVGR